MYKPTFYITMEADPAHFNPEGEGLARRLWSFTAPVDMKPSLTQELGISVRMKCSARPYWNASDPTQQDNWETVALPALRNKLSSITDVLAGCNEKRYQHYEGDIHHVWLKLQLDPYELRIRLDHDAEGTDYLPDALKLVQQVRQLANGPEVAAFAEEGESLAVYLPSRAEVEQLEALRDAEAQAWVQWKAAQTAEEDDVETNEEFAPSPKPDLAPGLVIGTAEFVKPTGEGLVLPLP